jgi:hypothetical protein
MEFQLQTMEINTTTPLFSLTFNLKPKHQEKEYDHDLDLEDSTLEIMQNCLDVQIFGPTCERMLQWYALCLLQIGKTNVVVSWSSCSH